MATVSHISIVNKIIEGDGIYPGDDIRVVRIVQYHNQFNGSLAWGLIFTGEDLNRYHTSPYCIDPETIWEYKPNHSERV